MHKRVKRRKLKKLFYLFGTFFVFLFIFLIFFSRDSHDFVVSAEIDCVTIIDDGDSVEICDVSGNDVASVVHSYDESIGENDRIFPGKNEIVFSGDVITIEREKKVTVAVDDAEVEIVTYRDDLAHILERNNITLDDNDVITPAGKTVVTKNMIVEIVRVDYEDEIVTEKIPFEKVLKKDDDINFLKKYIDQEGENGSNEITYRIAYHDGEEVDRKILSEKIIKDPVDEITVQGTEVKLGKKHTGLCSWYAYTGTMSAANPWLPKGSYVKVTNKANGKSVIVQINDRGPFVPGRIVDLDKVAFEEIASLGAGVIDVKMEEVVN